MIIANPIYDTVFKRLMENKRVASFFVGTLIGEHIENIAMVPQEYTYFSKGKQKKDTSTGSATEEYKEKEPENKDDYEILSVIRFDFVATIRTADGEYKKVLIEVQKSNKAADLQRFRTYLGEQYKRVDMVEIASGKVEKALPIITIYLLGFTIPKIDAVAIKVNRTYIDMIGETEIQQKSEWIESLTHDGYFVQIPLVKGKPRTSLEKLLSIFEQHFFIDDKETVKDYGYPVDDDENLKTMVDVLRHAATDARTRREMEEAWWAELNEKEYERMEKELVEHKEMIAEQKKINAELEQELADLKRKMKQ